MKEDRFLWSAHRITERQKAGKARSIKGKQFKNSRSTVSKQPVVRRSSASADLSAFYVSKPGNHTVSGLFAFIVKGGQDMPVRDTSWQKVMRERVKK